MFVICCEKVTALVAYHVCYPVLPPLHSLPSARFDTHGRCLNAVRLPKHRSATRTRNRQSGFQFHSWLDRSRTRHNFRTIVFPSGWTLCNLPITLRRSSKNMDSICSRSTPLMDRIIIRASRNIFQTFCRHSAHSLLATTYTKVDTA